MAKTYRGTKSITLPVDLIQELEEIALENKHSFSQTVEILIKKQLDEINNKDEKNN